MQGEEKLEEGQMENRITNFSARDFVGHVSEQPHAMAGAVIALAAAQAVSLGLACLRITPEGSPGHQDAEVVDRMETVLADLLAWADRDADAIARMAAARPAGRELVGQQLLCEAPARVAQLAVEAAQSLERFRPAVLELVRDDLEIGIRLLAGAAQAALLLLDSNLRIWPEPALLSEFKPLLDQIEAGIGDLRPIHRVRG